jgi:hypothetical protein
MELKQALDLLNSKFVYKADPRKYFDSWKILYGADKWEGDCEDYSLTLIWLLSDKSLIKFIWNITVFKYLMWYVKTSNGVGHAVVKIDGLYYDNIQKRCVSKQFLLEQGYNFKFPMLFPFIYIKLILSYTIGKLIS